MPRRFLPLLLSAVLMIPAGAAGAASGSPSVALPAACASGSAAAAASELFGRGTELARFDKVTGLTTALVLEPYILPGTRHRLIAVAGGWCDAERAFNYAWQANGRSFAEAGAMAEAYARLAAAPYFDRTKVISHSGIAGAHTIETHALTNGVEAKWTVVTDPLGVRTASWASTAFAVKPFVAQWEGLTALDGAKESYARVADGLLQPGHGLPVSQVDEPAAEVSYTGPDGFKIVVGVGDSRNAVDVGSDTGNERLDLLRMTRSVIAENYQDFYDWGFRAAWAPARLRVVVAQVNAAPTFGPPNTGYVSINDSTSFYCQACVFIADDFQIHLISEVRTFLDALGYSYPGVSDRDVLADVLGHEMFHNWQNNYTKPTASGRSVPGSYSEGTARFQETLHAYSAGSHQPESLVYAKDANGCNGVSMSNASLAGGAFQSPSYSACNFWLPWYGANGIDALTKLVTEGAPAGASIPDANAAGKVIGAIEVATGESYAVSAAEWAAGLITGKGMEWGSPDGSGASLDWGLFLNRWNPGPLNVGESATATLSNGGVMARRVGSSFSATITSGAVLAVLRSGPAGASLTYPADGEVVPGPGADEKLYVIGINPGTDALATTISTQGSDAPEPTVPPVATALYLDGTVPIGEAEGLAYLKLVPQSSGSEKSMQLLNYGGGPNTNCAGNSLFPVFVGSLSGRVTGDVTVNFKTIATGGAVDIRVWPDVSGQLCNETYVDPARELRVSLPPGPGLVQAVLSGADFDAGSQIMIQITPVTASPFLGRMFYGTADARVELNCSPSFGEEDCLP